uniref:N-terminal domain-containing protein n=1 Tax=viral metagenome TaxID=1070528 RepID=A0A6M3LJK7_9ZZZZ
MVGFKDWGIPADEIEPTVNVLTYHAWRALGRQVRKGEKGVHVVTWVPVGGGKGDQEREEQDGERKPRRQSMRPRTASVFHVSQTDVVN